MDRLIKYGCVAGLFIMDAEVSVDMQTIAQRT
jgi:hypothetical protein